MTPQESSAKRTTEKVALTAKVGEITGKRFCAHHQASVNVAEGGFVQRGKVRRWICFRCQNKGRKTA